jgi:hypothetical protein
VIYLPGLPLCLEIIPNNGFKQCLGTTGGEICQAARITPPPQVAIPQPAHSFNPAVFKQDDLVGPLQLDYLCGGFFVVRTNKCTPYKPSATS